MLISNIDILPIIAELADSGALDRVAQQTGAGSFQIGHAACGALLQVAGGRPIGTILAASIADAGISPSLAHAVESALIPLIGHHFAPQMHAVPLRRYSCLGLRGVALRLVGAV